MSNEVNSDEKLDIANAMIDFGGSFVKALGYALIRADSINTYKIKITFDEYWLQYKEMAKKSHEK